MEMDRERERERDNRLRALTHTVVAGEGARAVCQRWGGRSITRSLLDASTCAVSSSLAASPVQVLLLFFFFITLGLKLSDTNVYEP